MASARIKAPYGVLMRPEAGAALAHRIGSSDFFPSARHRWLFNNSASIVSFLGISLFTGGISLFIFRDFPPGNRDFPFLK